MSSEDLILLPAPQFERARQRLEFWASDEIAPHVIDCSVEPLEFEHSGRAPAPGEDPYALLTPFFEFLPRFVNLKSFNAFTVHFSSVTLARFFLLPALSSVSIDMCVLARPEEVLEAPPKVLNLTRFLICNTEDQIDWWFRALCPDALRVVAVDMSGSYDQRFFFEMQPTFPFLPNVHTLTLSLGKMVAPLHLITLSKFPGVKRLKLLKWHHLNGMVPVAKPPELGDSELCPLLQEYIGPFEILKLLPIPAGLRRVIIDHCALDEFLAAMRVVSTSNEIQQLEITTLGYAIPLAELVDMFPELKVFVLTVQGRGWMDVAQDSLPPLVHAQNLLINLPSSSPRNIVKLAITWHFEEAMEAPDLPKLKDDILFTYPTLETLWIHCRSFAYVWSKMPDGTESVMNVGPETAPRILDAFDDLFYGYWFPMNPE